MAEWKSKSRKSTMTFSWCSHFIGSWSVWGAVLKRSRFGGSRSVESLSSWLRIFGRSNGPESATVLSEEDSAWEVESAFRLCATRSASSSRILVLYLSVSKVWVRWCQLGCVSIRTITLWSDAHSLYCLMSTSLWRITAFFSQMVFSAFQISQT